MDIHSIFVDSVALNISVILNQHDYGTINIDDPESQSLYAVQFTKNPYTLHY